MTKTKKVAVATVAIVMVGAMAVSFVACGKKDKNEEEPIKLVNMSYSEGTELNVAIGYSSQDTGMFYGSAVGTGRTFVGNYGASAGVAKPATKAIQEALGVTLVDQYGGKGTSSNLTELVNSNDWGTTVDMATSDLSVAVTQAARGYVLNLADYLDYMPNFKAFLEENPIVYLSILQAGMDTSNGSGQKLYVAPYFDGMDDIEKGVLMRQDWIEDVLDYGTWTGSTSSTGTASDDTFKTACYPDISTSNPVTSATGTSAESYMGTTGSWSIVSTAEPTNDAQADGSQTVTIKKDYDAALAEVKDTSSELYSKWSAIAGSGATYSGTSGNIVDIMNAALNSTASGAKGLEATGEDMAELYRAYISVAYSADGKTYYGVEDNPYSNVFNGYSACWDVDDLTVLLRIIKCSSGQVGLASGEKTTGIYPRDYTNSRTPDIISLVGELYGCRGATSRYENTYIDGEGTLQDARNDERFWEALDRFGGLAREGLLDSGYVNDGAQVSESTTFLDDMHGTTKKNGEGFMQWDYSQTQTTQLFDGILDEDAVYGWVNTPVSLWNDGTKNETGYSYSNEGYKYMRFTDSWRSTKTAGLVVAASVAEDEEKLAAALSFVDYLYTNDGQITTTYAIQDTSASHTDASGDPTTGTWYGDVVEDLSSIKTGATNYTDLCDETSMWVIKEEYKDQYVVHGDYIYDRETNDLAIKYTYDAEGKVTDEEDISTKLETYAEKTSWYSVKSEYESKCFTYGGTIYTGTLYKGKMTPTITDELYSHFTSATSPEASPNGYSGVTKNFTNFARYILGSTLPICVKDQSFENQMTAEVAQEQATKVSVSIGNNTINHCDLTVREDNYFYTCVPTGLPLDTFDSEALSGSDQNNIRYLTGTAYADNNFYSLYHHVIWYGFSGTYNQNGVTLNLNSYPSATDLVSYLQGAGLTGRLRILKAAWVTALDYWDYLGAK